MKLYRLIVLLSFLAVVGLAQAGVALKPAVYMLWCLGILMLREELDPHRKSKDE